MPAWTKTRAALRPDTVARAVSLCVDTRRGVLVVGPPGAGASQCAAEIATGLRAAGVTVVVWDDLDRSVPGGRGARRELPDGAVLVASARVGATLPPGYDDEVSARTTRLPLRNFTRTETEAVVSAAVGMPLSARLLEALWGCSHGNLAALRATYDDLALRGLTRRTRHRLELTVDPATAIAGVAVDPRIWVGPGVAGPGGAGPDLDSLTTAALARHVSMGQLERLHTGPAVSDLVARALLTESRHDGVEMLTVCPPVLARALRTGAGQRRRREVYDAVLARAHATPPDPRIVLWAVANDRSPDIDTVLVAAHTALDGHDYRTGVELHEAVRRAGLDLTPLQQAELTLVAGSCLRLLERLQEAAASFEQSLACLQRSAQTHDDDDELGRPEFTRVLIANVTARADLAHYRDRGPGNSLPMIEAAHQMLPEGHPGHTVLGALTVVHLSYAGRYREAVRAYAELGPLPSAEWERRLEAIHALALDAFGQSDTALAGLRRLARRSRTMDHHAWASEEYLAALLSVVLHGYGINALLAELAPFVAVEQDDSVRVDHGMRRVVDAEIALAAGDLPSAVSAAADGLDTVEVDGPEDFLPRALSLSALTCALAGQTATASEHLERMRAIPGYTNSPVGPEIRGAEAGVLFCLGRNDEARGVFRSLVDDGLFGAATRAALGGLLLADPETCRAVSELDVTGDVPLLVKDLAAAMLARNPRLLLDAARRARGCGMNLVAAIAADRARTISSPGSQHRTLAERMLATTELSGSLAGIPGLGGPAGPVPPGVSLTRRESQIAELVGQGMTNAEIAAELHLSKRTVEGHLNRIYTKTGTRLRG